MGAGEAPGPPCCLPLKLVFSKIMVCMGALFWDSPPPIPGATEEAFEGSVRADIVRLLSLPASFRKADSGELPGPPAAKKITAETSANYVSALKNCLGIIVRVRKTELFKNVFPLAHRALFILGAKSLLALRLCFKKVRLLSVLLQHTWFFAIFSACGVQKHAALSFWLEFFFRSTFRIW